MAAGFARFLYQYAANQQEVHLALSGGSTPKLLFQLLASESSGQIDWQKVHLYWGDERCVPPDHSDSNFGVVRDLLLDHINIPEANIHRVKGEADPQEEAKRYSKEIRDTLAIQDGWPVFDIILLGMGGDGHTASIFPHQMELLDPPVICEVAQHPESGQQRITLTGRVINNAKEVVFLVTGEGKAEKTGEILNSKGAWESYPAAHIRPNSGQLHWFLDQKASASI